MRDRYVVSAPLSGYVYRVRIAGWRCRQGRHRRRGNRTQPSPADRSAGTPGAGGADRCSTGLGRGGGSLAGARAALLHAKARSDLDRTTQLREKGVAAVAQLDRDTSQFQSAERELAAADRRRHAAEHPLEQARAALRRSGNNQPGREICSVFTDRRGGFSRFSRRARPPSCCRRASDRARGHGRSRDRRRPADQRRRAFGRARKF